MTLLRMSVVLWAGCALALSGAPGPAAEREVGGVIFSWQPGEPEARTPSGPVPVRLAAGARAAKCPAGGALRPGPDGGLASAEVSLGEIRLRGTISFWVRLGRSTVMAPAGQGAATDLIGCQDLRIRLIEGRNSVRVDVQGARLDKNPRAPALASFELTHLRGRQWYHMAVRYDGARGDWGLILNGVLQPKPWPHGSFRFRDKTGRIAFAGLMKPPKGDRRPIEVALGPVEWTTGFADAAEVRRRLERIEGWDIPPNRGEGVLEAVEDFDGEALGGEILFEDSFDAPLDPRVWVAEGAEKLVVEAGGLVIHNSTDCLLWLNRKLPRDFVAAWDLLPARLEGLTIVILSAMGVEGKGIFDPSVKKRKGTWQEIHAGDLRSYYCSYFAATRGSCNMRKNPGLILTGMGPDPIGSRMMAGEKGPFRVVVVRRGSRIDMAVDRKRFLTFEDDGKRFGPVHKGGGYFGWLHQFNTKKATIDNVVIRKLKD